MATYTPPSEASSVKQGESKLKPEEVSTSVRKKSDWVFWGAIGVGVIAVVILAVQLTKK